MATVEAYETGGGLRYRVRYRTPENKQTSKRGFKTKKMAELFAAKIEVDKASGDFINPIAGRVTVGELAPTWLKIKSSLKPSSYTPIEMSWRVYVKPKWGATAVNKIKPSAVEAWISELLTGDAPSDHKHAARQGKPLSATSVLRAVGVLAGVLDLAVKDRLVSKNPVRGTGNLPKKQSTKPKRYLSHSEVARLAAAAPSQNLTTLIYTFSYAGLRWGEAAALTTSDLAMLRQRINITKSATWVQRVVHLGSTKNWETRAVPFPHFLGPLLAAECEGKGPDDLIFPDPNTGSHLRMPDLRSDRNGWWIVMCRAAGIKRLTPHDLRHTCASLAVSAGAHVKTLQRMLGHKSAAMTLDIYADLFDGDLDAVSMSLDQARSESVVSTQCPRPAEGLAPTA